MKTSFNIFNRLTNTEMINLIAVTNETIADLGNVKPCKSFSTADLWNIQRKKRSSTIRRYYI